MNDPQENYRQWAEKQVAMGRTVAPTTAPHVHNTGLAEKAPKLYDQLFERFLEITDSTPGNWARLSVGSWQNQITGTIFTVGLG